MSMIPDTSTSTTITHQAIRQLSVRASLSEVDAHLEDAQDIVLRLWASALPRRDDSNADALVAAHRAINEARTMLNNSTTVVAAHAIR